RGAHRPSDPRRSATEWRAPSKDEETGLEARGPMILDRNGLCRALIRCRGLGRCDRDELGVFALQGQRQAALYEVHRIGAEHLAAPALERRNVALAPCQPVELVGPGDQPTGDA